MHNLYLPNLNMGALGTHNVLFVATEANTVYAFNADAAGAAMARGPYAEREALQTPSDYSNTRVPEVGITSTPVIDTSTNTIYLVAASKTTTTPTVYHQRLHALDVTTGKERLNSPADIQAKYPGSGGIQDGHGNVVFNPLTQFNRVAASFQRTRLYGLGFARRCRHLSGWLIAYNKTTMQQVGVYNSAPDLASRLRRRLNLAVQHGDGG